MSEMIDELEPLVWHRMGVLAARISGRAIIVVSDPDVMNNAGLTSADNAAVAHDLIVGSPPATALVFDETIHDFTAAPSIWREFFRTPLSLVTIHLSLAFLAAIWIGAVRFGKAVSLPPSHRAGTTTLVEATSRLLSIANRPGDALGRYWKMMLRRTAEDVVPGCTTRAVGTFEEDLTHLNAIGRRRGIDLDLEELDAEVARSMSRGAESHRLVNTALSIYTWRRDFLYGPHRDR
jgi:hypothetical protein